MDLEPSREWKAKFLCTCESFHYGTRPCRHIEACLEAELVWVEIEEPHLSALCSRLHLLLQAGYGFPEAIQSHTITSYVSDHPAEPPAKKRIYHLKPR